MVNKERSLDFMRSREFEKRGIVVACSVGERSVEEDGGGGGSRKRVETEAKKTRRESRRVTRFSHGPRRSCLDSIKI